MYRPQSSLVVGVVGVVVVAAAEVKGDREFGVEG
jgi:hypothetical protein